MDYTIDAAAALTIVGSLELGTSVTIDTSSSSGIGAGAGTNGDITVSSAITKTAGGAADLTLNAQRNIALNASISTNASSNLIFNAAGSITSTASGTLNSGGAVTLGAGHILIGGVVTAETLGVSGSASFVDRNAGTNKTVTVADISALTQSDGTGSWSNYPLANSGSMGSTANVTLKSVTLTAGSVSKTYDGLTTYTLSAADLDALSQQLGVSADKVSAAIIRYLNQNAGSAKAVTLDGATIQDGNGGNNYDVTLIGNSSSSIGKAPLQVRANDLIKAQDGVAFAGGNGVRYAGFVNGEDLSALSGALAYAGSSQGAVTPGSYGIEASGLAAANYAISYETGTLRVVAAPPVITNGGGNGSGNGLGNGGTSGTSGTGGVAPLHMEGGMGSGLFSTPPVDTATNLGTVWLQVVREPSAESAGFTLVYVPTSVRNAATGFRFALPEQALSGVDKDSPVQVTLLSGEDLPDWLRFDSRTRMFVASRVPPGGLPLRVRVIAGGRSSMLELLETKG